MTHDQNHPEHAQDNGQPMNIAALLRAAADGELTDDQCEQLNEYIAQNPQASSQIGFEQALKACCSRAMSQPTCPEQLRAKVLAIAANAPQNDSIEDEQYAQRLEAASSYTKSQSFWARSPMMGVAAALLIMVAGTLIWQSTSLPTNAPLNNLTIQQANYYNRVSDFVVREHTRCCDDKLAQAKLVMLDLDETAEYFDQAFKRDISVPDMDQASGQIEFFGGGDCQVPSTPRSGHLRFDAIGPQGQRISLSLFVSPDPKLLPLEEGLIYALDSQACAKTGTRLFAWISEGVQYLLVSEASDEMCAKVRSMMNAPTTFGNI